MRTPENDRKSPMVCDPPPMFIAGRAVERPVSDRGAAGRLGLIETRPGDDVHDQAALVAVFCRGHTADDLERLDGVLRH